MKTTFLNRNSLYRLSVLSAALALGISTSGALHLEGAMEGSHRGLSSVKAPLPAAGGQITHDAALYERIKQLDLERAASPTFEDELSRLSAQESHHREKLPGLAAHPRLQSVVKRLSAGPYRVRR